MVMRHKKPNNFYTMQLPVKVWHNLRAKNWRLLDSMDTIIADNLTRELAETLEQAVNLCPAALEFTKFFVEWEHVVDNREDAAYENVAHRNTVYNQALDFMVKLKLIKPPPTFINAFPAWRDEMMHNFYERMNRWLW